MAAVDGKIETVRMIVMDGFEDSLTEAVKGDTEECVWCKKVDGEVRLYGAWLFVAADVEIAAEGDTNEGVMEDTGDCVWGTGVDIGYVRLCSVWDVALFAGVEVKIEPDVMQDCEGNIRGVVMGDVGGCLRGKIVDMEAY